MSKSLEELKNELWEIYKEENPPKGQARFYYNDNCEYWKDGFDAAIKAVSEREDDTIKFIKDKIEYHKQAYSLELFPNSETIDDNSTRESISAKMGRHMCDVFLGYINEALKEFRGGK